MAISNGKYTASHPRTNCISLIGMSGVGKSTLGRSLSKKLNALFVDTDSLIEKTYDQPLQTILHTHGDEYLKSAESRVILDLAPKKSTVFSTGGSVIYSESAMMHLRTISFVIFLDDDVNHILKRVKDIDGRGIIGLSKDSFEDLYRKRRPLYQSYAHATIPLIYPFHKDAMMTRLLTCIEKEIDTGDATQNT